MASEYERLSRAKESESARWRDEARAAEARRATDASESAAAIREAEERAARATRRADKAERRCRKAADAKDAAEAALERAAEHAARREAELTRRAIDAERDAARRVEAEAEASRERDATFEKLAESEKRLAAAEKRAAETEERLAVAESSADAKASAEATRRADEEAAARAEAERELASVRAELESVRDESDERLAVVRAERDAAEAASKALEASLASARAEAEASAATASRLERDVASLSESVRDESAVAADALRRQVAAIRADAVRASRRAEEEDFLLTEAVQALASRAALYERARAENKRLHNAVQDLKGSIRVFCRVRPRVPGTDGVSDLDAVRVVVDDEGSPDRLVVRAPTRRPREDPDALRTYAFDRVFGPDAAQSDVYEECSALIRCVCDGYNVCFLAYGQTGSGKTHTMSGDRGALSAAGFHPSEALGVNDRALRDVFAVAAERASATSYEVSVSVLEIYNERCVDLLAEEADARVDVTACGSKTGENVPDATARRVSSAEEVREVMREGEANRATGATAMNERSSRSHSVVMVRVDGVAADSGARTRGVLYLVDLAGSERLARSEARGERLKESQHINKSLSALGDVVGALRANSPHVPYRNSKLTTLLQGALGPSGKALCFVHVSPAEASAGETVSTLDFATRVASVELGRAKKNTDVGGSWRPRDVARNARNAPRNSRRRTRWRSGANSTNRRTSPPPPREPPRRRIFEPRTRPVDSPRTSATSSAPSTPPIPVPTSPPIPSTTSPPILSIPPSTGSPGRPPVRCTALRLRRAPDTRPLRVLRVPSRRADRAGRLDESPRVRRAAAGSEASWTRASRTRAAYFWTRRCPRTVRCRSTCPRPRGPSRPDPRARPAAARAFRVRLARASLRARVRTAPATRRRGSPPTFRRARKRRA